MRLIASVSASHARLVEEWFLPTVPAGFEPVVVDAEQLCASGEFRSDGWMNQVALKFVAIEEATWGHDGEIAIFSDVDIRFFEGFTPELARELLGDRDIAFQQGSLSGTLCAGFYIFRVGDRARSFFQRVEAYLTPDYVGDDETAMNEELRVPLLRGMGKIDSLGERPRRLAFDALTAFHARRPRPADQLSWRLLPSYIWNPGLSRPREWRPGDPLRVPRTIHVHHANYTVGVANKLAQLAEVDRIVASRA
ncbi:MAG: putative nucleotide-diphospho-sugar transferase [Acidimicrobiales bacterium]